MIIRIILDWARTSKPKLRLLIAFAAFMLLIYFLPVIVAVLPFTYLGI